MKKICSDFNVEVKEFGFNKSGRRAWQRVVQDRVEAIHFHRRGSSYGSSLNNSIDIRVELYSRETNSEDATFEVMHSDMIRKADGYVYHHRFNAKSWSTYDRCLEELLLFTKDFAEPWFQKQRKSKRTIFLRTSNFFKK